MLRVLLILLGLFVVASAALPVDHDAMLRDAKAQEQARTICASIIAARPGSPVEPGARLLMGRVLAKNGSPVADAIAQFLQVVSLFPAAPETPEAMLHVGYLRDRTHEEPSEWQMLVDQHPSTKEAAEALLRLGFQALRKGNPELAANRFKSAAATEGAEAWCVESSLVEAGYAHISRYWKTLDTKALTDAVNCFLTTKSKPLGHKATVRTCLGLGEAYLILGLGQQAVKQYKSALELQPDDPYLRGIAQFELGCSYYFEQDWSLALAALDGFLSSQSGQTLLEKDSHWKSTRPRYSQMLVANPGKARTLCGVELVPDAAYYKALALFKLGRSEESQQIVDEVATGFPGLAIAERVDALRQKCAVALTGVK